MRLFVAICFTEEIKNVLLETIKKLRGQTLSGNFTDPENLHLTLAFIGESNQTAAVCSAIDACELPPFTITIDGLGNFGDLYWVGIEKNTNLSNLANDLQNNLRAKGFDIEKRAFKPHITVARQVKSQKTVSFTIPSTTMTVSRISLMKSERINGKLTYTELYGRRL